MTPPVIEKQDVHSLDVVRGILPWREQLASAFGTGHGNADLQLIDVMIVMLAGFFNPMVRSQRLIDALSSQEWMQELTGLDRIPKSTLSDALMRFNPEQLRPMIKQLAARVPALGRRDADLQNITKRIIAADGSYFQTSVEAACAMLAGSRAGQRRDQIRWNLQFQVDTFTPLDCDVSFAGDESEPAAFIRNLHPDVIYVADRNFFTYAFINAVLETGSNLVLRLRKGVTFDVTQSLPLSAKDAEAGVLSDDIGRFHGASDKSNQDYRSFTAKPPVQLLRRVVVKDQRGGKDIVLLTDLLDVPAHVIAALYRQRWQVELFFKWFKTYANFDHLMSRHPNGISFQFYVAVIATLLLHLATGRKVSKYALFWLGSVACGRATFEEMQVGLARIEREKELERARKKKAAERKKLGK
jgi:Transposase DDE domain